MTRGELAGLCRAKDRLREVHDERLSIGDVAREAAMSPYQFIRRFRAVFGETPHQFRIGARLDRAKQLLAVSDYSVTDVCMEVGFSSLGSFSDLFARRVGVAPSAFRRRIRAVMPAPRVLPPDAIPGCLTLMGAAFAIFEKQSAGVPQDPDAGRRSR
jgi:AraC-like DNA-binding protein